METQGSLTFHDTVPLDEKDLPKARETAKRQEEKILDFFRANSNKNFTPIEVYEEFLEYESPVILLTSIRRSITNLTKKGKLIKCAWSESRDGGFGKLNRVWKYNTLRDDFEPFKNE